MLSNHLHDRAGLSKQKTDTHTVFSFWPTRSEYMCISLIFGVMCKKMGAKRVEEDRV